MISEDAPPRLAAVFSFIFQPHAAPSKMTHRTQKDSAGSPRFGQYSYIGAGDAKKLPELSPQKCCILEGADSSTGGVPQQHDNNSNRCNSNGNSQPTHQPTNHDPPNQQTNKQTNKQTNRQTDKQTDKQTSKQTSKQTTPASNQQPTATNNNQRQ